MAKIYDRSGEHVIICAIREAHIRPFQATDWLDLRVGFFLSLCGPIDPGDDNTTTGLSETITGGRWTDRVAIGLTDSATGQTFCGYTNLPQGRNVNAPGDSKVVTSDEGVGTTNAFYWRAVGGVEIGSDGNPNTLRIIDTGSVRASGVTGSQAHFIQSDPGAGEYCTFFGLRFTRPDTTGRAKIITMTVKKTVGGHSSDLLFTDDPSNTIGESQLESFPTDVQTLGPVELSQTPDTFFFYWPFHNSRLRIHEVCILKSA